jgi:membrane protein insertase Oxa1/YidC/SpoIIIJ
MIAFFGFKYRWASALYIYWLALNVFTVAQQYIMFRRYGLIGGPKPAPVAVTATEPAPPSLNGATATAGASNGKRSYRSKRRSRR